MDERKSKEQALDAYLVASARVGDAKALRLLVRRWNARLLAHGWRLLGDPDAAKDAVQDGWVEIVRSLHRLAEPEAFPAWAYRIVSRRCSRTIALAQKKRRIAAAFAIEPPPEQAEPTGAGLDAERVRAAMERLPAEQRAAIALFHLQEMSVAEVAVALDVPVGTVKTRLMHARRKLRAALEGEE